MATAADAQTCTVTYYGPSALCSTDPVTAMVYQPASGSWTSVTWTISGGRFHLWEGGFATTTTGEQVAFSADGTGPVTLTIRGTTSTGCTTPDTVVTLPLQDAPVLTIAAPTDSCYGVINAASVLPPADGSWYNVNWTIEGGYFWGDNASGSTATGENVQFVPFTEPVILSVYAQHTTFCQVAPATMAVDIRTVETPAIIAPAEMCMNTTAPVSLAGPPSEGSWAQVNWSIENGYFVSGWNHLTSIQNTGEPVTITPSWPGPAIVRVYGYTTTGCWTEMREATVALSNPAAPVITAPAEACPNSPQTATLSAPAQGTWSTIHWTIEGGYFRDQYGNQTTYIQNGGEPVTFEVSSPGPARISAGGQDSSGCWTTEYGEVWVAVRSIPQPVITAPAESCPNAPATATISQPAQGTWERVMWSISGGYFRDQFGNQTDNVMNTGQPVTFEVSSPGPALILAMAQDSSGCSTNEYAEARVAARTILPPAITAPSESCPGAPATATIAQPAQGTWDRVMWSISGGYFQDQFGNQTNDVMNTGEPVTFELSSPGPALITAMVQDSFGCWTNEYSEARVAARTILPPAITAPSESCPGAPATATIAQPAEGTWDRVMWSISGGTFRDANGYPINNFMNTGQPVTFEVSSPGPALITAMAQDSFGCWTNEYSEARVAARTILPPAITAPSESCPGAPATATIAQPAEGTWDRVMWSISGGTFRDMNGYPINNFMNTGQPVTFEVGSPGPAVITAMAQDSFGCWTSEYATATVAARVIPAPVITAPAEACPYSPQTATIAQPAQGTWDRVMWSISGGRFRDPWGNFLTSFINTGGPVTFEVTSPGPAVITAGAQDSFGCWTEQASVTVSARTLPAPVITAPASLCPGLPGTASISAPASGSWTRVSWSITGGEFRDESGNPRSSMTNLGAPVTFVVTAPGPATITAIADDDSGCQTSEATVTITNTITPEPEISLSTATLCLYTPATATVTNAGEYSSITWSISGDGVINGSNTGATVTFVANGPGPVTLTATPEGGCAAPSSVTVPVHPTAEPSITASHAMPFCPGTAVTLTASEGASWLWSTGATTRSIVIAAGGSYSVTITGANGCAREATFTASEHATPEVTIVASGPTRFCEGGNVTLTPDVDAPGATYLWSSGATTRSITTSVEGTYSVTVTYATGCTKTSPAVTVTTDPVPEAAITADNNAICNTNTGLRLYATAGADAYLWSNGQTTSSIAAMQPGDYTVTVTKNGCSTTSAPFTVIPAVYPAEAPIPTDYWLRACPNGTSTASVSNPGAFAYFEWTIDDGEIVGPNDQASVTFRVNSANTTVRVRGFSETGCSYTNNVNVLVGPPPSDFNAPARICRTVSTRADILAPQDEATYSWSIEGGTILHYYDNAPAIAWRPNGGGPVTITATATRDGCSTTTTKTIEVDSLDAVAVIAPRRVCTTTGHTATAADAGEGATYTWYMISGGVITSPANQQTITYDVDPNAPYTRMTLAVGKGACLSYIGHDTVYDVPQAAITASRTTLCPGGSATLTSTPATSYLWSNGATTQSITITEPGSYTVTTTSQGGCSRTSAPVVIGVETAPAPVIELSPSTVCWSQTDVAATVTNAAQYTSITWLTNATPFTATNNATVGVRRAVGNTIYWVEAVATTPSGCEVRTRVDIPVEPEPDTTITSAAAFCEAGTYTVSVPDAGPGATYQWRISHGTIVSGATSATMTIQPAFNGDPLQLYCDITVPRGCMTTAYREVPVSANPVVEITGSSVACAGSTSGTARVAYIPGATYQWAITNGTITMGQGTDYIYYNATAAGTLTLEATVTVNGCSATDTHTVTVEDYTPTITAGGPTEFCPGGSVTLTADGPEGAYYTWSSGQNTKSIVVSSTGTYFVTVAAGACSRQSNSITVMVNQPPPMPDVAASGPLTFCPGGSVTLTAPDGYTYLWSNGSTAQSITVSEEAAYEVTVYDGNGCGTTSQPVYVYVEDAPGTINTWTYGPTTFCEGGSVMIVTSSEYGHNFLWSTGETTQAITVRESGNYTVSITNDAGCSSTSAPVTVTVLPVPAKPVVTASGPTTFCHGGSVTLSAPEGYTYSWSNGATTREITVEFSGVYSVTVTNGEGCGATSDPVYVQVNNPPLFNWTYYGEVCLGVESSREITAPPDAASYDWSITNGTITRTEGPKVFFVATADPVTLTVTVTNTNGCTYTSSMPLRVNSAVTPTITAGGSTTFCAGGSVTLTSSVASSYLWSNGATTRAISVSQPGSYSVTITDANGCSATSAPTVVTVNDNPGATITATGPLTFCDGSSVTLNAPTGTGLTYLWSTGSTDPSITVHDSGNYTVTVTSAGGCSVTSTPVVVTVHDVPDATITPSGSLEFCDGGSVTLSAPTGTGLTYIWSNGSTDPSITVSEPGSYSVTVTNASNCSRLSAPVVVTVHDVPEATITYTGSLTFCDGNSVTLNAPTGTGLTYLWSTGSTDPSITVYDSGNYTVTVTNASGCSVTSTPAVVTVHDLPEATISHGSLAFCDGNSVTLSAPTGTGLTYLWSNGSTDPSITVSEPGSYSVTVTNASNCSRASTPVVVTVHDIPEATISYNGSLEFCTGESVTLNAPTGTGYTYLWSNGSTQPSITVSQPGSYTVSVTNAAGCSTMSQPVAVTVHPLPAKPAITPSGPLTFCQGGTVRLTAPDGYSSYLWSNGSIERYIDVTATATVTVTVTDGNGCSAISDPVTVTVHAVPPVPQITYTGSLALCPNTSITLNAPGGYSSYLWSNGQTGSSITVSAAGQYSVTVSNGNCSRASAPVTVSTNQATAITAQPASITMPRNVTRQLSVTATGTATLQYQWYEGFSGDTSTPVTVNGTSSTLTVGPFPKKGTHRYWVRVTSSTCTGSSVNSTTATVTVN